VFFKSFKSRLKIVRKFSGGWKKSTISNPFFFYAFFFPKIGLGKDLILIKKAGILRGHPDFFMKKENKAPAAVINSAKSTFTLKKNMATKTSFFKIWKTSN